MKDPPSKVNEGDENHGEIAMKIQAKIQSAASIGILVTARKWPRMVDPTMSMRTIQAVRRDSSTDLTNPFKVRSFLAIDKKKNRKSPHAARFGGSKETFHQPAR